jgi:hypothetical protein
LTLATACQRDETDERTRRVPMTLIEVHGEIDYGAHRLPAGKTAAGRTKRGRPADQAAKLFEDRQLQLSKALAPFVKTPNCSDYQNSKST